MNGDLNLWLLIWSAITAIGTWGLVLATWWLVQKQLQTARSDLRVKIQMSLEDKFEGNSMVAARSALAKQLLAHAAHQEIQEDVMNFFESVGVLLRRGYLDPELAWVGFGFFAFRWWCACQNYIEKERARQGDDKTIYEEFETLANTLYEVDLEHRGQPKSKLVPDDVDWKAFLETERDLR